MSCASGQPERHRVPKGAKDAAKLGLLLRQNGFAGGTETGWARAAQLPRCTYVDGATVRTMRAWFARHGPGAANGGTSYRGYLKWIEAGRPAAPERGTKNAYRGAVAWLLWGGDGARRWVERAAA